MTKGFPGAGRWASGRLVVRMRKAPGYRTFQGLPIHIEHDVGDTRSGVDGDGKPWTVRMSHAAYGEIVGTIGADGDPLDVFIGPNAHAPFAYAVQSKLPGDPAFDESKSMLGFNTRAEAEAAFRAAYNRPGFLLSVTTWPMPSFLDMVRRHPALQRGRLDAAALAQVQRMAKGARRRLASGLRRILAKARVKAHQRKLKDGRTVAVKEHQRKDAHPHDALRRAVMRTIVDYGRPLPLLDLSRHLPRKHRDVDPKVLEEVVGDMIGFGLLKPQANGVVPGSDTTPEPPPAPAPAPPNGIEDPTGLAMQLVLAWRDYPDPQTRAALERLMLFSGMARVGAPGDVVPFNGIHHSTEDDLWPDDPAVIVTPGWGVPTDGRVRVLERAKVRKPTDMEKAKVKAHQRKLKDGRTITVKEHERKDRLPKLHEGEHESHALYRDIVEQWHQAAPDVRPHLERAMRALGMERRGQRWHVVVGERRVHVPRAGTPPQPEAPKPDIYDALWRNYLALTRQIPMSGGQDYPGGTVLIADLRDAMQREGYTTEAVYDALAHAGSARTGTHLLPHEHPLSFTQRHADGRMQIGERERHLVQMYEPPDRAKLASTASRAWHVPAEPWTTPRPG